MGRKKPKVAKGKAGSQIAKAVTKTAKKPKPPAKLHQVGSYGDLKKGFDRGTMQMDHIPSRAARVKHAEDVIGDKLTPAQARKIRDEAGAIAIEGTDHVDFSRTYGGRNTTAQIAGDAADLPGAVRRDLDEYVNAGVMTREQADAAAQQLLREVAPERLTKEYYLKLIEGIE